MDSNSLGSRRSQKRGGGGKRMKEDSALQQGQWWRCSGSSTAWRLARPHDPPARAEAHPSPSTASGPIDRRYVRYRGTATAPDSTNHPIPWSRGSGKRGRAATQAGAVEEEEAESELHHHHHRLRAWIRESRPYGGNKNRLHSSAEGDPDFCFDRVSFMPSDRFGIR
jgi:hypothetical protein